MYYQHNGLGLGFGLGSLLAW